MKRYKLSKHVSLARPAAACAKQIPEKYRAGYVLADAASGREYLVNETVNYFVEKFSVPKSREEIIAEAAADSGSTVQEVAQTCNAFIDYLRKKNILIGEAETEPEASPAPFYKRGDCIGDYTVCGLLDNTPHGEIYLVAHRITRQRCVIKLLNRRKVSAQKEYEGRETALEREYRLLQKAESAPSVSKAYAFSLDPQGNRYLTIEYIKGGPVLQYAEEQKGFTANDYRDLLHNLLQAFAQLHQCGIVHGDVHSSNVMATRNKTVRIIDLGLSIQREELAENEVLKYGGADYYMPPERISTSSANKFIRPPGFRSDVYQTGVLLYAVLYHQLPFDGFTWEELATAIKHTGPLLPDRAAAGFAVPPQLKNIVQKCLEKDPEKRYADACGIFADYIGVFSENTTLPLAYA